MTTDIIEIREELKGIRQTLEELKNYFGIGNVPPAQVIELKRRAENIADDILRKHGDKKIS